MHDFPTNPLNPRADGPSILVRRLDGAALTCVNGKRRLEAALRAQAVVNVYDVDTSETLKVHLVGDRLLAVSEEEAAEIGRQAEATIARAAGRDRQGGN